MLNALNKWHLYFIIYIKLCVVLHVLQLESILKNPFVRYEILSKSPYFNNLTFCNVTINVMTFHICVTTPFVLHMN